VQNGENCVSLLLTNGADVLISNKDAKKPIDLIKDDPYKEEIYKLLSGHGTCSSN
jgi:hypothetical protein